MQTWNGTGTMLYSWRTTPAGERTAMKWFTVMFIPVLPLARYRLRVRGSRPEGFLAPMHDEYDILEQGPVAWPEALATWGALLKGLALVAVPWTCFFVSLSLADRRHEQGLNPSLVIGAALLLSLVGAFWATIALPLRAIRRARG